MVSPEWLSALPNHFPYNEMLFDGKLRLGNFRVKTRSYDPGFRGPVLLYTSARVATPVVKAHNYNPQEYVRPAIVGIGDLKFVRPLNEDELDSLLLQFNNATSMDEVYSNTHWVEPCLSSDGVSYGLFFQRLKRFPEPIEFTAESGPVRRIKVPLDRVVGVLAENGIKVVENKLVY